MNLISHFIFFVFLQHVCLFLPISTDIFILSNGETFFNMSEEKSKYLLTYKNNNIKTSFILYLPLHYTHV